MVSARLVNKFKLKLIDISPRGLHHFHSDVIKGCWMIKDDLAAIVVCGDICLVTVEDLLKSSVEEINSAVTKIILHNEVSTAQSFN